MEIHISLIVNIIATGIMGFMLWLLRRWMTSLVSVDSCTKLQALFELKNIDKFTTKNEFEAENMEMKHKLLGIEKQIQELREDQQEVKRELMNRMEALKESMADWRIELSKEVISALKKGFISENRKRNGKKEKGR